MCGTEWSWGSTRVRKAPYRRLALVFPCLGLPSTGALCLLYFLSFYNHPGSLISMPLVSSQVPSFVPQEKKLARCCRFESLSNSGFIVQNMAFIGPTRLEQTFHWLISVSRDFRSPKASFPIHLLLLLLFKYLDKGSLVPPMCTNCRSSFPRLLHYLHKVVGCFVPRSRSSFLVPDETYRFITVFNKSLERAMFTNHFLFICSHGLWILAHIIVHPLAFHIP